MQTRLLCNCCILHSMDGIIWLAVLCRSYDIVFCAIEQIIIESPSGIQFAGVCGTLFLSLYDLITQLCTPTRLVSLQIQTYSFDWIKWAILLAHKIFYSIEGMVNIPFPAGVRTGVVYVYASYVVQMALNLIIFLFYRYRFIIKLKAWNMSSTWN